jgi:hypothetical protein
LTIHYWQRGSTVASWTKRLTVNYFSEVSILERLQPRVLGFFEGCTNPESAELLPDGETVIIGNASMAVGMPWFRDGKALVYIEGAAFLSRARIAADGCMSIEKRVLASGLTATLGCDVLHHATGRFPAGTLMIATGGGPAATPDGLPAQARPHVLAVDPMAGDVLGRIPLWAGSDIAARFNALEMPNGLAVGHDGTVFVSDMPNTNPDPSPTAPPFVQPAVYALPHDALDALADGEPGAAEALTRVVMPGFVNGLAVSPLDGACVAVSCSRAFDPVNGGIYVLTMDDFASGRQPNPLHRDLDPIDGVGVTRRGTIVVSNPLTGRLRAIMADGVRADLEPDDWPVAYPADINVVYPTALSGEPALLVPDVSVGRPEGTGVVGVLDLSGL